MRRIVRALALVASVSLMSHCAAEPVSYSSLDELAADSSAIIAGTVLVRQQRDGAAFAEVEVDFVLGNPQLATNAQSVAQPEEGDVVLVRDDELALQPGGDFLLFVIAGDADGAFSISADGAAVYGRGPDGYHPVDEGADLPDGPGIAE